MRVHIIYKKLLYFLINFNQIFIKKNIDLKNKNYKYYKNYKNYKNYINFWKPEHDISSNVFFCILPSGPSPLFNTLIVFSI